MKKLNKIGKVALWSSIAATVCGAALGSAEFGFGTAERRQREKDAAAAAEKDAELKSQRHKAVKTEAIKTRFGKTKFVHKEILVDGYGKEVTDNEE